MLFEEKLRLQKTKLEKLEDDIKTVKEKNEKALKDNSSEIINKNGVAENAFLNVTVLEAKDIKPMDWGYTSDPYCVLYLDDERSTTTYKPTTLEPVWNEDFTL